MTRGRFLSLAAGLPAVQIVSRVFAQPAPKSGALLVTVQDGLYSEDTTLLLVDPEPFSYRELWRARGLAVALAPDKTVFAARFYLSDDKPRLSLASGTLTQAGWRQSAVFYPGQFSPRTWRLAVSPDGRWLYTFIHWLHQATIARGPDSIATDNDGSYYETFAYTFDVQSGKFLPQPAMALEIGDSDESVFIAGQPRQFDIYVPSLRSITRRRLSEQGAIVSAEEIRIQKTDSAAAPAGPPSAFESCSANGVTCFIHGDGFVVIAANDYRTARIEPIPEDRWMSAPSISSDGKLLFVPTGPKETARSPRYVDRIGVYEMGGFSKVRELRSQRPLGQVVANADGSRLYAILPDTESIAVLNSASLWQEKVMRLGFPAIRGIVVVP